MISNHRRPGRARMGPVLVSVVIVLICAGVLIPGVGKIRKAARNAGCQSNNKQIGLAIHSYESAMNHFPKAVIPNPGLSLERQQSWMVILAPYLEGKNPNARIDKELAWDDPKNAVHTFEGYIFFNCSRERPPTTYLTSYLGISGVGADAAAYPINHPDAGFFGYDRTLKLKDISDLSTTLMILETNTGGPWAQGGHSTVRGIEAANAFGATASFGSTHRFGGLLSSNAGSNGCLADGSGTIILYKVDPNVLMMLARIRGEKNLAWE